jgi:hypothetical protein
MTTRLTTPTISDFLKQIDEYEGTDNYYQSFLVELERQKISVRILSKLSDEEFEKCGVDTIGARQTLCDYAIRYNNVSLHSPTPAL